MQTLSSRKIIQILSQNHKEIANDTNTNIFESKNNVETLPKNAENSEKSTKTIKVIKDDNLLSNQSKMKVVKKKSSKDLISLTTTSTAVPSIIHGSSGRITRSVTAKMTASQDYDSSDLIRLKSVNKLDIKNNKTSEPLIVSSISPHTSKVASHSSSPPSPPSSSTLPFITSPLPSINLWL
ncbi:hypothetical protein HI914_02448 [Erysiphe necator]|nr:hypothetical protein HI914_02448 [Erysiphe necator]